jgi:hypothetical protein
MLEPLQRVYWTHNNSFKIEQINNGQDAWLRKSPTCRQHVATTAKCWHIFFQMPLSWRHNFDQIFLYSMQATYLNSSVRFGQNICLISVCHGRSCSSWHKNLKSLQLPELFQHKAASIKQHLLSQHKLHNNIEPAHPYRPFQRWATLSYPK